MYCTSLSVTRSVAEICTRNIILYLYYIIFILYYIYKLRYFYTFTCLRWFRIIAVYVFLTVTAKKTVSRKRGNTASEKRLSFLLSHIIPLYTKQIYNKKSKNTFIPKQLKTNKFPIKNVSYFLLLPHFFFRNVTRNQKLIFWIF